MGVGPLASGFGAMPSLLGLPAILATAERQNRLMNCSASLGATLILSLAMTRCSWLRTVIANNGNSTPLAGGEAVEGAGQTG